MNRLVRWLLIVTGVLATLFVVGVLLLRAGVVAPPKVPAEARAKSVVRDPSRLQRAWALPVAATYQRGLYSQSHGSFCGPASLVNVWRSLGRDVPDEAAVLEGSGQCPLGFCFMGLTLDELAGVARSSGGKVVTVLRDLTPAQFKAHLVRSNDPTLRYVVNFHRKAIFGSGGGHHSPIGGYIESDDTVLVLDVNADFAPWLIERDRLFQAVDTLDGDKKRGMLLIE